MTKSLRSTTVVLVVEDNADAREIFALTLSTHGYQVLEAEDGQDALAQLAQHPVDVILTDLRMPRMNGFELAEAVKHNPQWMHIPIVVLTATPLADKKAMLTQFAELLVKPCSIDDLIAAIDHVANT